MRAPAWRTAPSPPSPGPPRRRVAGTPVSPPTGADRRRHPPSAARSLPPERAGGPAGWSARHPAPRPASCARSTAPRPETCPLQTHHPGQVVATDRQDAHGLLVHDHRRAPPDQHRLAATGFGGVGSAQVERLATGVGQRRTGQGEGRRVEGARPRGGRQRVRRRGRHPARRSAAPAGPSGGSPRDRPVGCRRRRSAPSRPPCAARRWRPRTLRSVLPAVRVLGRDHVERADAVQPGAGDLGQDPGGDDPDPQPGVGAWSESDHHVGQLGGPIPACGRAAGPAASSCSTCAIRSSTDPGDEDPVHGESRAHHGGGVDAEHGAAATIELSHGRRRSAAARGRRRTSAVPPRG